MINVSAGWIQNQNEYLTSESFIKISFKISDPEASTDATIDSDDKIWFSDVQETMNGEEKSIVPYATLEHNIWLLDGSKQLLPDSSSALDNTSYVGSSLSQNNGLFTNNPIINISFTEIHDITIPAISIVFDEITGEYAKDFKVHIYSINTLKETLVITDNKNVKVIVQSDIKDYDQIQIEIVKWCLPSRRVRINEIFLGIVKEFNKKDLTSFSHSQEADPIGASTPKVEMDFSIDNTDNVFNPDYEEGLYKYLARKQELIVQYGYKINGNIEYINAGKFYLSEWESPQNGLEASFVARDLLEFMGDNYIFGNYSPNTPVTLYDLAEDVLTKANLPTNEDGSKKWVLSDVLRNYSTNAPLPICTYAECLQYIAQAGCCVLFYDRAGNLHIEPISNVASDYQINRFNSYSFPEVTLQKILKNVNVKVYHYYVSNDIEEVFNGVVNITGTQTIVISYTRPCVVNIGGVSITNGTLVNAQFFTNTCVLEITANGDVGIVINGNWLEESTSDYLLTNDDQGEEQSVDNPLVTSTAWASTIANWVQSWLNQRKIINATFRVDPRLDVLDTIQVVNKFSTQNVRITSTKFTYSGAFSGTAKGRVI